MKLTASVITVLLISTNAYATDSSSEEHSSFGYNRLYPSTVNFNEIFTNSLSMLNDEAGLTTVGKDDDFHINSVQTQQFAEFRSQAIVTTTTTTTTPQPRFLTATYLKKETTTDPASTTTSVTPKTSTSTDKPRENPVRVLPLKNYQRGVLDLIFPSSRVKNFKNVFDTVRRMLSYTFRK